VPQEEEQQELETHSNACPAHPHPHRQHQTRLPAQCRTTISKNHAIVFVEDLKVRNMSRSAAGTVEQTGSNVRQKAGLNRSILDQGWGEFRRQLDNKLQWAGGMLLVSSIAKHQHDLSRMWPRLRGKSQNASAFCLYRMRFYRKCRSCRRDQHSKGGSRPVRLSSELRSKRSTAGTHRKGGIAALVGISFFQKGRMSTLIAATHAETAPSAKSATA
jgi:hypothetical protein